MIVVEKYINMESHVIRSLVDEMIDIVAISETENFLGNSGDSTVDAMGEMTEVGTDKLKN